MENILTNQPTVKVQKNLSEAASDIQLQGAVTLWGQRGWAKYRDSENFKGVPRVFCGVEDAPLPLPALFPRAAVPCGVAKPVPGA
jgi:hypothetical protein